MQRRQEAHAGWERSHGLAATAVSDAQSKADMANEAQRRKEAAEARRQGPAQAIKQEEAAFQADVEAYAAGFELLEGIPKNPQTAAHDAARSADALHSAKGDA